MPRAVDSVCLNHPGVEAAARCKQCNKPVCGACIVKGPTGNFCSDECKEKHEYFVQRAHQIDRMKKPSKLGVRLKWLIAKLFVLVVLLLFVGAIGTIFQIPVLSSIVASARKMIGL